MSMQSHNPLAIRVEGWRGISHSYALVNQFQLLHWQKNNLAAVQHIDMPFVMAHWASGENSAGFNEEDLKIVQNISQDITQHAVYRIFAPFGLDTPVDLPTLTFAVTEFGLNRANHDQASIDRYAARGGLIHTPSHWSKNRLVANGIPEHIIHVVPHAADSAYFFQMDALAIAQNRLSLSFSEDDIILLNVGTHHWNKGLDVLIKSFAYARQKNPNLKLVLKDQRSTYLMNSESYVHQILTEIDMNDAETTGAIRMLSGHLTLAQLNSLYNLADAYLTPYRAEGFNLPALEAQTCGTPVIATAGGATDDFLGGPNHIAISGKFIENANLKEDLPINAYIEPDLMQLIDALSHLSRKKWNLQANELTSWPEICRDLVRILN